MPAPSDTEIGPILLALARQAIRTHLCDADGAAEVPGPAAATTADAAPGAPEPVAVDGIAPSFAASLNAVDGIRADPRLTERGATFVTLLRDGALRGCIGSLHARRSLGEDLVANAIAAATCDPRFPPLDADELARILIEVSLLSAPRFLDFSDEDDLLRQLRPGEDGLILFSGCRSATFLPQVWGQLPEPRAFLAALKQKAGLPSDRPAANLVAAVYSVQKWVEAPADGTDARPLPKAAPEPAA